MVEAGATARSQRAPDDAARPGPVGRVAFGLTAAALIALAGPSAGVRDAGELTAAAFRVDVPHPTGFVADMVLMRLAMLLPVGDAGFRANVFVAVAMALAAALAARLAFALAESLSRPARWCLASLPPVAIVASPTTLRAGTAAEVYALSLCVALASLSLLRDAPGAIRLTFRTRIAALLAGATLLVHTGARPAALLALLVLVARAWGAARPWRRSAARLGGLAALAMVSALGVVYLPLAARRHGPSDWGDPSTPGRLLAHLTARRIRVAFADRMLVPWRMPGDLGHAAAIVLEDLGPLVVLAGVLGAIVGVRDRIARWIVVAALVDLGYAVAINPMGVGDRQTLFVLQVALPVLAALLVARVLARAPARLRTGLAVTVVVVATALAGLRFDPRFAARADGWAETEVLEGAGALGDVAARSIVLCESDDLCGGALYAQGVEGERPDVVVLPRQHLADASTWRRARALVLDVPPGANLRVARLRALVQQFSTRIRWEQGETDDEFLAHVALGTGETPALAVPGAAVTEADTDAAAWLAPRMAAGTGAHAIGANVLFAAGRRLATLGLERATPLWLAAVNLDPELAPAYTNLGVVRAREGDLVGATALARRATEIDPERLIAWRNLAGYLDAQGDAEGSARALAEYRRRGGR